MNALNDNARNDVSRGIIVKVIDYKENSKIAYIVGENGIDSLEFRGANKPNSHTHYYSSVLTHLEYLKRGHFFSSGKILNAYTNTKLDIDKLKEALGIIELSYTLISHITDTKLFYDFLYAILELIENDNEHMSEFYSSIFYLKTMYLLGIAPNFVKCTECGRKDNLAGFVFDNGGMKCKDHLRDSDSLYDMETIIELRKLYLFKLDDLKANISAYKDYNFEKIKDFIVRYYDTYLGYKSKSDKVFDRMKL